MNHLSNSPIITKNTEIYCYTFHLIRHDFPSGLFAPTVKNTFKLSSLLHLLVLLPFSSHLRLATIETMFILRSPLAITNPRIAPKYTRKNATRHDFSVIRLWSFSDPHRTRRKNPFFVLKAIAHFEWICIMMVFNRIALYTNRQPKNTTK